MKLKSPYLTNDNRLGDVIAAIQVMGTYKFYKMDFASWADRITGETSKADYWKKIFEEHPEFFRLDNSKMKASLVWRRQYPKRLNVDKNIIISKEEFYNLPQEEKERVSRNPLESSTIEALIKIAIEMQSRALDHQKDKRWLITLLITGIGGLLGALIGGLIKYG